MPTADSTRDARGAAINLLGLLAQAVFPAFHVQLARFLGAADYGLYMWSAIFVDLFSVVTLFGCDQAVMRQVSLHRQASAAAVGSAMRVVLASGAVVFGVTYICAPSIAALVGKPGLVAPLRCLSLVPIFYHVSTIFLVATQALHAMRWAFWARSMIQPLVLLVTTGIALRAGFGPAGAAIAVVIGMAATALASAAFYAREMPLTPTLRAIATGAIDRDVLRIASPLVLANFLSALVARVDTMFLGRWGTEAEIGAYAACGLYAASISQVRSAFEPVTSALVAPALAKGDTRGLSAAVQRQTRWLALATFPLAALLVGFGEPLLRVFGHEFTRGAPALAVLAIGHTVNALALSSLALPLAGHGRAMTWVALAALIVQTTACAILVPRYGTLGAALAMSIGLAGAQTAQMILAARLVGATSVSMSLVPVLACAAIALGVGRALYVAIDGALVVRFGVGVALAALTYAVSAWAFALTKGDRALALSAVRRARQP